MEKIKACIMERKTDYKTPSGTEHIVLDPKKVVLYKVDAVYLDPDKAVSKWWREEVVTTSIPLDINRPLKTSLEARKEFWRNS